MCWEDEDRKHILLCDKCDAEYHTYCLDPPLEDVPEGTPLRSLLCQVKGHVLSAKKGKEKKRKFYAFQ